MASNCSRYFYLLQDFDKLLLPTIHLHSDYCKTTKKKNSNPMNPRGALDCTLTLTEGKQVHVCGYLLKHS